ncbi:MAG: hypothetical protein HYR80_07835, partial [Nitrospirae bacterium]|nr:hypothetical protein [Nitrospirota bacterium]
MPKKRVVVTGLGLVTPLGIGVEKTWKALIAGESGAGMITRFDTQDYPVQIAAEVKGFDPADFIDKKEIKKMDTFIHYAIAEFLFFLFLAVLWRLRVRRLLTDDVTILSPAEILHPFFVGQLHVKVLVGFDAPFVFFLGVGEAMNVAPARPPITGGGEFERGQAL